MHHDSILAFTTPATHPDFHFQSVTPSLSSYPIADGSPDAIDVDFDPSFIRGSSSSDQPHHRLRLIPEAVRRIPLSASQIRRQTNAAAVERRRPLPLPRLLEGGPEALVGSLERALDDHPNSFVEFERDAVETERVVFEGVDVADDSEDAAGRPEVGVLR